MKWFGSTWAAPINEDSEHVATPVGAECGDCERAIRDSDRGVILPSVVMADGSDANGLILVVEEDADPMLAAWAVIEVPFHLDCFLRQVLGGSSRGLIG